jgi:hypothetical protein
MTFSSSGQQGCFSIELLTPNAINTDCKQGLEIREFLQGLGRPIPSESTGNSDLVYHDAIVLS